MAVHTFQTPQAVELEIKIPAGQVEVETIDGTESTIELVGSDRLIEQVEVVQNGRAISVEYKKRFGLRIEIGDLSWGSGSLRVHARVPHGSDAQLSTAAADMELRGSFGSLETKSAAGDLTVDGDVTGNARIKTVSGDVRLRSVGGDLTAQSVSGDIEVGVATGTNLDVDAGSVSGDLSSEVALGSDAGEVGDGPMLVVRGKTVSGDFKVFRAA